MRHLALILFVSLNLTINECISQIHLETDLLSLKDFELCHTSRLEIIDYLGTEVRDTTILFFPYDDLDYGSRAALKFESEGMMFEFGKDGSLLKYIHLIVPFEGVLMDSFKISLGQTTVSQINKYFPDLYQRPITKTYWSLEDSSICFYVKKDSMLDLADSDLINRVIIKHPSNCYDLVYFTLIKSECLKPLYSPKEENHLNCMEEVKDRNIIYFLIPGDQPIYKIVKEGSWKIYNPDHSIKEQGRYKNDKKVGKWIYYKNGITKIRFHLLTLHKIVLLSAAFMILFILKKYRKNTKPNTR